MYESPITISLGVGDKFAIIKQYRSRNLKFISTNEKTIAKVYFQNCFYSNNCCLSLKLFFWGPELATPELILQKLMCDAVGTHQSGFLVWNQANFSICQASPIQNIATSTTIQSELFVQAKSTQEIEEAHLTSLRKIHMRLICNILV